MRELDGMTGAVRLMGRAIVDVGRAVALAIGALAGLLGLVVGVLLLPVGGLGIPALVALSDPLRWLASVQRRWVASRLATDVPEPSWPDRVTGTSSVWRRFRLLVGYPMTWRLTGWLSWQVLVGVVLPVLLAVPVYAGVAAVAGSSGKSTANLIARVVLAVALCALTPLVAAPLTAAHAAVARWFLAAPGNRSRLDRRADELARSRSAAIRAQEDLVRRLERDLHDGTQAHVVSTGMTVGLARSMLPDHPDKADELLAEAARTIAQTLDELRAIVHGIRPPVLAERGLGEAVRAVAVRSRVPVDTRIELPGPFPPEVETAVYFAVAEALTNVVRHSGASRATLTLTYGRGTLGARVADDGHGGADDDAGSGLRGLRDRLGAFDGLLAVDSPAGGPTEIRMEVPCEPLSPKTSLSSATG